MQRRSSAWTTRVVAARDRVEHERPHAGPGEHRLGDDGAGQQLADLQAEHGRDRDERVAQAVAQHRDTLGESLGARGADEVLAEDLEHAGAREPRGHRDVVRGERHRGQHELRRRCRSRTAGTAAPRRRRRGSASARARTWRSTGRARRPPSRSRSSAVPRNTAASTPTARPSTITMAIAVALRSSGGGEAAQDDRERGLVLPERGAEIAAAADSPRKTRYCTGSGWSSPWAARNARRSASVASGVRSSAVGIAAQPDQHERDQRHGENGRDELCRGVAADTEQAGGQGERAPPQPAGRSRPWGRST